MTANRTTLVGYEHFNALSDRKLRHQIGENVRTKSQHRNARFHSLKGEASRLVKVGENGRYW